MQGFGTAAHSGVAEPALRFRRFRTHRVGWQANNYNATLGRLAFSEQGSRDYNTDLHVFLRRHRAGDTEPKPPVGHYFAAFGPAADHVERYFDYWEEYALGRPGGPLVSPVNAPAAYPPEVFPPARQILEQAMEAARQADLPEYARRVAFLEAGLEHARLTARFIGLLNRGRAPDDAQQLAEPRAALGELIAFRREHEHLYIADYIDAARRENRWLDIDTLLSDE